MEKLNKLISETDYNYSAYYDIIPNLIKKRKYKKGIEIGVFCGGHAKKILDSDIHLLVGIDPYKLYNPGMPDMFSQEDWDNLFDIVVNHKLKSDRYVHLRMESNEARKAFDFSELYDFIFIDGLHTYDQLKQDLENYTPLIRKGGIISCHDYLHPYFPDLTVCIDEFAKAHNTKVIQGPLHLVYMEKTW